ncbi:MAG TPA: hypothetical protein VMG40_07670 [Bryobacteraceae bacterium]|nr:hypothetical protein [Bryobacteraceae bacterium]
MHRKAFIAVLAVLLASPAVRSGDSGDAHSDKIAELLLSAKGAAASLRSDIATLNLLAVSAQAQATVLSLYQQDIATLRGLANKLDAAGQEGSPAQQTAVRRIVPVMQEFASSAEASLRAAANRNAQSSPEWGQYVKLNSDLSGEFASLINAWADYARTREELDQTAKNIR